MAYKDPQKGRESCRRYHQEHKEEIHKKHKKYRQKIFKKKVYKKKIHKKKVYKIMEGYMSLSEILQWFVIICIILHNMYKDK